MDNLPELRDIHLPPHIPNFPLGWGMVLIALGLVLSIVGIWMGRRIWRQSKKYYALRKLDSYKNGDMADICEISKLLRRICIVRYPEAIALSGQKWIDFLKTKTNKALSQPAAALLAGAPYMPKNKSIAARDFEAVHQFAHAFLEDNL